MKILQREMDKNYGLEDEIITRMVEKIEDPLFSGPCEIIKNWDKGKHSFCDAAIMLCAQKISKMVAHTNRRI